MAETATPTLSNYEIHSQLSSGGMGAVYLAEDLKLHRKVAIKALTPEWAADPDRYRRFRWEAQTLARLNHPNIVTIYAIEEEAGAHFLIMELVEGETLDRLIPSVGMPPERVFEIAIPLADALAAAHEQGIVHRDLKPANVMVTADGRVKVLDFGLAKRHDSHATPAAPVEVREPQTRDGQMLGTIPYMSPEQLQGDAVDGRSDIFSLGIILYEMATGSRPFSGKTWGDLASSILRDKPPSVTALNVYLPRHLGRIIHHCLRKDPKRRFQTALDLRNELEELRREMLTGEVTTGEVRSGQIPAAGLPGGMRPSGALPSGEMAAPRVLPVGESGERRLAIAATVVVVAAVAALVWLRAGGGAETRVPPESLPPAAAPAQKRIVVLPLENLGPAEEAYFAAGVTEEITSRLASVSALQVISRTTALQYDRAGKTAREIGADLGVDYVLDGTVRWDSSSGGESRVRVTPQLIDVSADAQMWSQSYDRVIDDIFAVQSEIAGEVIAQLDIALLEPERAALAASPTASLEAYQAYLRGMDYASRRENEPETWELAVAMFEKAVELDPRFALAYAELSEADSLMYHWGIDRTPERREKARVAAERALEIDPDLPEGHRAMAYYHYRGHRDYAAALAEFDVAARALPNDSQLLEGTAYIWRRQGRFAEAAAHLEKAFGIQPKSDWIAAELAQTYTTMRRYQAADRFYHRAITLTPDQPAPYQARAQNYLLWRGDTAAARRTLESMPRQEATGSLLAWYLLESVERDYAAALRHLDRNTKARLIGVEAASYPRDLLQAFAYERLGEREAARTHFENARVTLERLLPPGTEDPRKHITLGLAYAGLGRKQDAVREGLLALEQYPVSSDAFIGPRFVAQLARIYVMVGDVDAALDRIEYLLSIPSDLSVALLRVDPQWDALRGNRRFEALLRDDVR